MNSLLNVWQLLGWTMILFLAAGTVVFLIGGAVRVILKRANPSVRYASSLVTLAVLMFLPVIIAVSFNREAEHVAVSREAQRVADERAAVNREAQRVADERLPEHTTQDAHHTNEELNAEATNLPPLTREARLTEATRQHASSSSAAPTADVIKFDFANLLNHSAAYLPWLWIVGTPLTFLLLATGLIGAERLRSSCRAVNAGPLRGACDELRAALGISRQVGVAICERIATPLLVGVVKPLILLPPAALNGWTTAELEMVLVHELAHVRRWDNAVNLGQRVVESLLFFHPAVWVVSGWVRRDREDCCDAIVVAHTARPQAYAELLLALASHRPGLAASVAMAQHPVAHRIRRILKLEDEPMLVTRKGLFIGVSAVVIAAILAFALPTTDAEEPVNREAQRVADKRAPVNREAERVADKRASPTNPTRQRGEEQTTKDTNNTKEELNAEDAKSAEGAEKNGKKDSVQYIVVYPLDDNEADIKSWLKALDVASEIHLIHKDGKDLIAVTGTRKEHEKVSDLLHAVASRQRQRPEVNAENPLFPSLEDQRAADLAYKLLGVELEKLSPEELERVKAQGYKGGLRVTGPVVFGAEDRVTPLRAGDLLVGLHVWPTESLSQVQEILSRYDMNELSPLKYYVLRQTQPSDPADTWPDRVVTGRIVVDLQAWAEKEGSKQERLNQSQPTTPRNTEPDPNPFSSDDDTLLYDGKTFDEWRNLWKTELKTEKRVECIKALAAFGRAGKGKEAAEAILDVAGEYDFGKGEGGSATDLKSAISQVLTDYESIDGQYWLPLLIERLKTDPDRWGSFAEWVLSDVQGKNVEPLLKQIAANEELADTVRGNALAGLAAQPNIAKDEEALTMICAALAPEQFASRGWPILYKLQFKLLDLFPEQIELFFLDDEQAGDRVLELLYGLPPTVTTGPIVDQLLKILDDPARKADRVQTLQALVRTRNFLSHHLGNTHRNKVMNQLGELLISGDDEILPNALKAASSISSQPMQRVIATVADKLSAERREQLKQLAVEIEQKQQEEMGGGGMGGGGGGAEMGGGGAF